VRRKLRAWSDRAAEEAVSWLLNPRGRLVEVRGGRAPPSEIEEAMARRVIAGSEAYVRRHRALWAGAPRAVPVEEIDIPLWGAQPWRRTMLK